jgi:hypothetical protein
MMKQTLSEPGIRSHHLLLIWSILFLLVVFAAVGGGCVNKILHKNPEIPEQPASETKNSPAINTSSGEAASAPESEITIPGAKLTPLKSEIVTEAAPFTTPDPYPVMHGTRINETRQYRFIERTPEFTKTYTLRGNSTGLLVNVAEGPLYIVYKVEPLHDCYLYPDTCRGSKTRPIQRPYLIITVRDNQTHEVVARDGYGGEFSSDTGHYNFVVAGDTMDGLTSSAGTGSNPVSPGPRFISLYKEGRFHITLEGNYLNTEISIITGTSPDPLETALEMESMGASVPPPVPENEEWT